MLLREHFDSGLLDGLPVLERASINQASDEQLKAAREWVVEYRLGRLGLKAFGPDGKNALDALTVLVLDCLENWPKRPEAVAKTSIAQGVDEFATTYIEFFLNGKGLLEVLRWKFKIESAAGVTARMVSVVSGTTQSSVKSASVGFGLSSEPGGTPRLIHA